MSTLLILFQKGGGGFLEPLIIFAVISIVVISLINRLRKNPRVRDKQQTGGDAVERRKQPNSKWTIGGRMRDDEVDWRSWRSKTDDQIADAAKQLSDYTEKAQRLIREELHFRGLPEPPPTERPIDVSRSPVVNRYQDAYRVGAALVGLGNTIKVVGVVLAGVIVLGSLGANIGAFGLAGIFLATIVGGLFWVCGVIVAAQGQILQATLDNAVASSHFLSDPERADAMGLPRKVADRSGA